MFESGASLKGVSPSRPRPSTPTRPHESTTTDPVHASRVTTLGFLKRLLSLGNSEPRKNKKQNSAAADKRPAVGAEGRILKSQFPSQHVLAEYVAIRI